MPRVGGRRPTENKKTNRIYIAPALANFPMLDTSITARTIDTSVMNAFQWLSEYSAAGYCNMDSAVGSVVSCEDSVCPDIENNGAVILATLSGGWESTGGVVIRDDVVDSIIVSFAGTVSTLADYVLEYVRP